MFKSKLDIQHVSRNKWVLLSDLVYESSSITRTVPSGYRTDLTSVPRILQCFIPAIGKYVRAAVLHDYLYDSTVSQRKADNVMLEAMTSENVNIIEKYLIFYSLRTYNFLKGNFEHDYKNIGISLLLGIFISGSVLSALYGMANFWWDFANNDIVHKVISFVWPF